MDSEKSVLRAVEMTTGNFEKNLCAIWSALEIVSFVFADEDMENLECGEDVSLYNT